MSRSMGHKRILLFGFPFQALTRDIWLICLSNVIGAFGEGLYFWIFPLYVRSLQADYLQVGIIFSILYGASALSPLIGGILADRFDRKKISIIAWTPWVLAPLIYSFAENWLQLIPGAICWGISMVGLPAINAYVATSTTDRQELASVFSFVWSTYYFSYIFAPAAGSYLATVFEMRWVLRLSALLSAAATMVFFFIRSQYSPKNTAEGRIDAAPSVEERRLFRRILVWSTFLMIITFFMSIVRPYVPTFLSEVAGFGEIHVGLFGSVYFAGTTFIGIAIGRLGDKWRESGALSVCLLLYVGPILSVLLFREPFFLMIIAFLFGGSAAIPALINSIVGKIAPENKLGLWISIPQTLSWLASFAAPYLGGYLYTQSFYYAFITSVSAIPFLLILAIFKLKE
ncbi:MAG: MFS transporter [Candidatus Bathycorpusculaceae bacterium]